MSNGRGRCGGAIVAGIVVLGLALAPSAGASVISLRGPDGENVRSNTFSLTGQPGEANRVRLQGTDESPPLIYCCPDPGRTYLYMTIDDEAGIGDPGPCIARDATHAECALVDHPFFMSYEVSLADGDDVLDITTDEWIPSDLGPGDDTLILRAGKVGGTDCGEGFDTIVADPSIDLANVTGCERVERQRLGGLLTLPGEAR